LLTDALREQPCPEGEPGCAPGQLKDPQVRLCPWTEDLEPEDWQLSGQPTAARPLVYHLFGRLGKPESLVLTQDQYFNYLIGVTRRREDIPSKVLRSYVDASLLFLGFELGDWDFRVLFRSIVGMQGNKLQQDHPHVAVQVRPEGPGFQDPDRARDYLEREFGTANVSIYWGTVQDFTRELHARWQADGLGS
jgi:hypothetical protein